MREQLIKHAGYLATAVALASAPPALASETAPPVPSAVDEIGTAAVLAQKQLRETFTNLQFQDFAPAPVHGPLYQAIAGGKVIYYAPQSEHILFAAVYDKNGVNVTALAQDASARKHLAAIDPAKALAIGPAAAPTIIEFTDPDCPYCRALDRFWATKAAQGKPVRRLIYFVSGIHPEAAAKAEHILCAADKEATFRAIYGGAKPARLDTCASGHQKVAADAALVRTIGVTGTPTLIADGKLISGFQQAELEAFLDESRSKASQGHAANVQR